MKKQISKVIEKLKRTKRVRGNRGRRLLMESLEGRRLMASDLHNVLIAEDVNRDFKVTALDALLVINTLRRNRAGAGAGEGEAVKAFVDVNGDSRVSPVDALLVINRLRAEGEEAQKLLSYSVTFEDTSGNPLPINPQTQMPQVVVGSQFRVKVTTQDLRPAAIDILDNLSDGGTVRVTNTSGVQRVFEFDSNNVLNGSGNVRVAFAALNTPTENAQALANAVNSQSGFGVTAVANGERVSFMNVSTTVPVSRTGSGLVVLTYGVSIPAVDLDLNASELSGSVAKPVNNLVRFPAFDEITLGARYSFLEGSFGAINSTEEFNEITAADLDTNFLGFTFSIPQVFFTADFLALETGVLSVTPNMTEVAASNLFGDNPDIPASAQSFLGASLMVVADPTSPVASNVTINATEDTVRSLPSLGSVIAPPLSATSPAGRTLTLQSIAMIPGTTVRGTLSLNGSSYSYTPFPDENGNDFLRYTVVDSTGLTSTATLTIAIAAVNDAPTAVADSFIGADAIKGDSIDNVLNVLANDLKGPANEASQVLTITEVRTTTGQNPGSTTDVAHAVGNQGGTVKIDAARNRLLYTPAPGFGNDTETFSYTISDGFATSTATVSIFVEPGVRPFARRDVATIAEDNTDGVVIDVLANDAVNEGVGVLPILQRIVTDPANGTVTIIPGSSQAGTNDQVRYVPNTNFNGTDTFTYELRDTSGLGVPSIGTVTVTVTDVNDPPELTNDTLPAGTEDIPVTVAISTLLANDSPGVGEVPNPPVTVGQTLRITLLSSTDGTATFSEDRNSIIFTPNPNRNGPLTFSYTAEDSGTPALSATAVVTVTLAPVNDSPVVVNDSKTTEEDITLVFPATDLTANDAVGPSTALDELQTQTLSVDRVLNASSGTVSLANGQVTYVPALNFNGQATFEYVARDSAGAETTGIVTVTVTAVNDEPTANDDSAIAFRGIPLTIPVADLLRNDSVGPDNELGQTISITSVQNAVNGSVSLNATTGVITFVPNDGYTGPASFEYTIADNGTTNGAPDPKQDTGLVSITVREFVPSTISGFVYVDDNNDGTKQGTERALGGVTVTLIGTALGLPVSRSYITLADGSYRFDGLAPGEFTVRFGTPNTWVNGRDTAGNVGDTDGVANNDAFGFNIVSPGGVTATNYNFAVSGLQNSFGSILDRLASRYFASSGTSSATGMYAVVNANGSMQSFAALDGFNGIRFAEAVINPTGTEVLFTVVTSSLEVKTARLGKGQFFVTHDSAGTAIIRIVGGMSDLRFETISSAPANYLAAVDRVFDQEGW